MKKPLVREQLPLHDQNHLFAALSDSTKERLGALVEPVSLKRGDILIDVNVPLEFVYFPIDSIVSLIFVGTTGSITEVAVVGNDGLVGVLNLLSGENASTKAYVMNAGVAYRLPKQVVQDEFHSNKHTLLLFLRYIQTLMTQASMAAACNRHHTIEQQFCKLLLLSLDRLPCNNLTLTQELASIMLGVRREGVSEAAVKLQVLGVIDYHRGHITVLDRTKLEKLACECYRILAREASRLIPLLSITLPVASAYTARPNSLIDPKCVYCFRYGSCIYLKQNLIQATKKCITSPHLTSEMVV